MNYISTTSMSATLFGSALDTPTNLDDSMAFDVPVASVVVSGVAVEPADVVMQTSPKSGRAVAPVEYMSFKQQKAATCKLFGHGMTLSTGKPYMLGYNGAVMALAASTAPFSWDDSLREKHGSYAAGACCNVYPVDVDSLHNGCGHDELRDSQPLGISVGDTCYDANVHMISAKHLYVPFVVDGTTIQVTMYSLEYFDRYAMEHEMAGGSVKLCSASFAANDSDDDDDKARDDASIGAEDYVWQTKNGRCWALMHKKWGLTPETQIPTYFRFHVAPAKTSVGIVAESMGHSLLRKTFTSGGMYSLSEHDTCYTNTTDTIRNCVGVWSKDVDSGNLNMCGIDLEASKTDFNLEGIQSMVVPATAEKPLPLEATKDDALDHTMKEEVEIAEVPPLPEASWGLYPFVGNANHGGTFLAIYNSPVRDVYTSNKRSYAIAKGCGGTRGPTRGSSKPYVKEPSPEPEPPKAVQSAMTFAKMNVGKKIYEVKGMGVFDFTKKRLEVPTLTIVTLLVLKKAATDLYDGMLSAEYDANAVELVQSVAQQVRDVDQLTSDCCKAVISGIHKSSTAIDKQDMSSKQLQALESTKAVNANASFFGF
jgi:hypothetical protein